MTLEAIGAAGPGITVGETVLVLVLGLRDLGPEGQVLSHLGHPLGLGGEELGPWVIRGAG